MSAPNTKDPSEEGSNVRSASVDNPIVPNPPKDTDSLDGILDCNVTGSDTTLDCARGTPCKHVRAALLKWRDEAVVAELEKLIAEMSQVLGQPALGDLSLYVDLRIKQLEAE